MELIVEGKSMDGRTSNLLWSVWDQPVAMLTACAIMPQQAYSGPGQIVEEHQAGKCSCTSNKRSGSSFPCFSPALMTFKSPCVVLVLAMKVFVWTKAQLD